jgi:cytochrome P450
LKVLRDRPHDFLRSVAGDEGVVRLPLGPLSFHFVTAPEAVERVLVGNAANYHKHTFQYRLLARITGEGLLTLDGPAWLRRRRLAQPSFHRDRVAGFAPVFTRVSRQLGDRWTIAARSGQPVDVAADMMLVALQAVVECLFGTRIGDEADVLARATLDVLHHIMHQARTLGVVPGWVPTRRNRRFRRALGVLDGAIYETLRERRQAGGGERDDLLGRLMAARVDGESLSDQELRDEMITLLIAGHETVASALAWTWDLLAVHPDVEARFHDEVDRLPDDASEAPDLKDFRFTGAVFEEALRLYPPAWIVSRKSREADVLGGFRVPAGALVVLSPYVTQRRSDLWPDPDSFQPERFFDRSVERPRFAYFPFGGGAHLCIGNHFAILEAAMILATLGQRFRLRRAGGAEPEVEPGVTLQPRDGLLMQVEVR